MSNYKNENSKEQNNEVLKKSIDGSNKYQQQTINRVQTMVSNYIIIKQYFLNL
jgi:hypothetical protein